MIPLDRGACPHPKSLQNRTSYKHEKNKGKLRSSTNGKCMYCESLIDHLYFGDVEHIKPKIPYPQFEFDWDNLGYVCAVCNNNKSDDYDDNCPIVNPYAENPEAFLFANGSTIFPKPGNERGELTIETLELNRIPLAERRSEKVRQVYHLVQRISTTKNAKLKQMAIDMVMSETSRDKEFSLVSRTAADAFLSRI